MLPGHRGVSRFGTIRPGEPDSAVAVSVPANIAEGHAKLHWKEFEHYLSIARGSLAEFETHLEIASRLGYLTADQAKSLAEGAGQVGRMLNGLLSSLRKKRDGTGDSL